MKQTAVEWLVNMWEMQGTITPLDIREAKRIEKEQIKDAYKQGTCHHGDGYTATEYYEETFKANER
jgi:hypothetical protein